MTVMALALAHTRENECDTLEGHIVYDSGGEVVGWLGQVMDESGYPCEYMGMGGEGYTSCWSSSEISRLREENAKLRELVGLMDGRDVLLPCWRGCDADCRFYDGTCERIGTLMGELGFEVDE